MQHRPAHVALCHVASRHLQSAIASSATSSHCFGAIRSNAPALNRRRVDFGLKGLVGEGEGGGVGGEW